jgi:SAM-dependent methyltransferase
MPGVNFDRAAAFYDATRALPDGVAERVRDAIVDRVGARAGTTFLEVGVGTGRIALPFVCAGHRYCGVDLSAAMLGALREKLIADPKRPELACADAMALPFRPGVFDVVLLIHVIHLVDDHLETLAEVRRVLRPNGRVIVSANEYAAQERRDAEGGRTPTGARLVTRRWNAILTELGVDRGRRSRGQWLSDEALTADLERLGASVERVVLARYEDRPRTARQVAAAHRDRIFSSDWANPDDVHAEASRRLDRWLETEHPAPDDAFVDQSAVVVLIGTFSGGDRGAWTSAGSTGDDTRRRS